jgi:hypothetical protein
MAYNESIPGLLSSYTYQTHISSKTPRLPAAGSHQCLVGSLISHLYQLEIGLSSFGFPLYLDSQANSTFEHLNFCLSTDFFNSLDQSLESSPPCCGIHHNAEELAILTRSIIDHETSRDQFLRDGFCGL